MPHTPVLRRTARLALAAVTLAAVTACNSDSTGPDHADDVDAFRLTIVQGTTTYGPFTIPTRSASPAVTVPVGTSTVTAQFLDRGGAVITDLGSEYRLQIQDVAPATAMTFTTTGQSTGTITAPAAGAATATVCVYHVSHCDVEALTVPVTIGG